MCATDCRYGRNARERGSRRFKHTRLQCVPNCDYQYKSESPTHTKPFSSLRAQCALTSPMCHHRVARVSRLISRRASTYISNHFGHSFFPSLSILPSYYDHFEWKFRVQSSVLKPGIVLPAKQPVCGLCARLAQRIVCEARSFSVKIFCARGTNSASHRHPHGYAHGSVC